MGTYDTIVATIKCPCCKCSYLDEDIQTKDLGCGMRTFYQDDDVRGRPNEMLFAPKSDMVARCIAVCQSCGATVLLEAEIRDYILRRVTPKSVEPPAAPSDDAVHLLGPRITYAARMGLNTI